jgi:hypothetical protein
MAVCVVVVLLLLAPAQSWAQTTYTPNPNPPGDMDQNCITAQQNGAQIAVAKSSGNRLYPRGYGPMQTKLVTCISYLQQAYNIISSLLSGQFDPLGLVHIILNTVLNALVMSLLTQVCGEMMQFLGAVQNFAKSGLNFLLSLICIPLPKWNGNIFGAIIPPGGHCGGNPFGNAAPTGGLGITVPSVQPYSFRQ